jgi:hypothetical protein
MLITDSAYQAGLARLHAAAASQQGPVVDTLDLLVLRADRATQPHHHQPSGFPDTAQNDQPRTYQPWPRSGIHPSELILRILHARARHRSSNLARQ